MERQSSRLIPCRRNSHNKPDRIRAFSRGYNKKEAYIDVRYTTWQNRGNELRGLDPHEARQIFEKEWIVVMEANLKERGRLDPWDRRGKLNGNHN